MFTPLPPTLNTPAPAAPVRVGVPPQEFAMFGAAAITTPAGSVSLKVRPVRAGAPAGLASVNVSVEDWPTPMVAAANALVSGARGWTVRPLEVTALVTRAVPPMLAAVLL